MGEAAASWYGWGTVFGITLGMSVAFYVVFNGLYGFGGGMVAPVAPMVLHHTATAELFGYTKTKAQEMAVSGQFMVIQTYNACIAPSVRVNMASIMHVTLPASLVV